MVKAEFVTPPVVRNVTITLSETDARKLMTYIVENGSWENSTGGPVAEKVFDALYLIGVREG